MATLTKVDDYKPKLWATIFLLLAIVAAWLVGDSLFFSGLVGAVLGWWFGQEDLASRLKNGLGGIGRAKFWALFWMSLVILFALPLGFIGGIFIHAMRTTPLFLALFGAIYVLVFVLESLSLIEQIDGAHYWVIAGMILGPMIDKAISATVIYGEIERGWGLYGIPFGALVGAIFGVLHATKGLNKILKGLGLMFVIYLASLLYGATLPNFFDNRAVFVMVAVTSGVWHLPWIAFAIQVNSDETNFGKLVMILVIALISMGHIMMFNQGLQEHRLHQGLKVGAVRTKATIYKCSGGGKAAYRMWYEYEVVGPDKQIQRYTKDEPTTNCQGKRGSQISIRYLPHDPSQATSKRDADSFRDIQNGRDIYILLSMMFFTLVWLDERENGSLRG